jgi:hypothetical protein
MGIMGLRGQGSAVASVEIPVTELAAEMALRKLNGTKKSSEAMHALTKKITKRCETESTLGFPPSPPPIY